MGYGLLVLAEKSKAVICWKGLRVRTNFARDMGMLLPPLVFGQYRT